MVLPYSILIVLLVNSALLDGATSGVVFYFKPSWIRLTDPMVSDRFRGSRSVSFSVLREAPGTKTAAGLMNSLLSRRENGEVKTRAFGFHRLFHLLILRSRFGTTLRARPSSHCRSALGASLHSPATTSSNTISTSEAQHTSQRTKVLSNNHQFTGARIKQNRRGIC